MDDTLLLASDFRFASFSNVKRLGNSVGHCLAKKAKFIEDLQVWMEYVLEDIAPLVVCDSFVVFGQSH